MSPITTHVLDTARGCPAHGVPIRLESASDGGWTTLSEGVTNADGRVADLLAPGSLIRGRYRMVFETATYFELTDQVGFYPFVHVVFEIRSTETHYHVPLLLSPYGYSTYRGS